MTQRSCASRSFSEKYQCPDAARVRFEISPPTQGRGNGALDQRSDVARQFADRDDAPRGVCIRRLKSTVHAGFQASFRRRRASIRRLKPSTYPHRLRCDHELSHWANGRADREKRLSIQRVHARDHSEGPHSPLGQMHVMQTICTELSTCASFGNARDSVPGPRTRRLAVNSPKSYIARRFEFAAPAKPGDVSKSASRPPRPRGGILSYRFRSTSFGFDLPRGRLADLVPAGRFHHCPGIDHRTIDRPSSIEDHPTEPPRRSRRPLPLPQGQHRSRESTREQFSARAHSRRRPAQRGARRATS